MKTITLKEAHKILASASALIIDDKFGIVTAIPVLSELNGKDENEFLFYSWWRDLGSDRELHQYCSMRFSEGLNREVRVSGSSIFLFDTDNGTGCGYKHESQITILTPKELE